MRYSSAQLIKHGWTKSMIETAIELGAIKYRPFKIYGVTVPAFQPAGVMSWSSVIKIIGENK